MESNTFIPFNGLGGNRLTGGGEKIEKEVAKALGDSLQQCKEWGLYE